MHFCTIAHNARVGFNNPDESLKLFVSLQSLLPPSGLLQAGLHSPATPILLPRLSSQTWLFAHSRELLFRLKFFGFLVALIYFRLQPCPKTLTRAVIAPILKTISSSINQSNLHVFSSMVVFAWLIKSKSLVSNSLSNMLLFLGQIITRNEH